jgi:hypothetical protein
VLLILSYSHSIIHCAFSLGVNIFSACPANICIYKHYIANNTSVITLQNCFLLVWKFTIFLGIQIYININVNILRKSGTLKFFHSILFFWNSLLSPHSKSYCTTSLHIITLVFCHHVQNHIVPHHYTSLQPRRPWLVTP